MGSHVSLFFEEFAIQFRGEARGGFSGFQA